MASEKLLKTNKKCTIKLYQQTTVLKRRDNFLVGPFSMQVALAFTQSICTHESSKEIFRLFRISRDPNKFKFAVSMKTAYEKICSESYTLENHLKFYLDEDLSIDKSFEEIAKVYGAQIEHINFFKNIENTTETINTWIRDQSKHEFDALRRTTLRNYTKIVLVNVPYLKAQWQNPALSQHTKMRRFYKLPNGAVEVEMMCFDQQNFNYCESSCLDAQILELPIIGDEVSMTLILPRKRNGILKLGKRDKIFASFNFKKRLLGVALPKFKIENRIDMKDVLQDVSVSIWEIYQYQKVCQLGVEKIFLKCPGNITGISDKSGKNIAINEVIQGVCINVNEEGVETISDSSEEETPTTTPQYVENRNVKTFVADHPFIFYIKAKNVIVLAGQVMVPTL